MSSLDEADIQAFRHVSFEARAKSIEAAIENLEPAIEARIEHSPRKPETLETCLGQVDELKRRLRSSFDRFASRAVTWRSSPAAQESPRVQGAK